MSGSKKPLDDELIGRALKDKDFRDRLLADPAETLEAEGYEATPELVAAIKSCTVEFEGPLGKERRAAGIDTFEHGADMAMRKAAA